MVVAVVKAEIDFAPLFHRLEAVVRSHVEDIKRGVLRDLRRAEYERDDARRNEQRANGRLQQMRDAVAERDATIAELRGET